jgi:hypothetical protein
MRPRSGIVRGGLRFCVMFVVALVTFFSSAYARTVREAPGAHSKNPYSGVYEIRGEGFVHNVGNLWMNVTNLGVIGNPWKTLSTDPSGQYPPGSGVEYLWGGGIWVGATVGDNPTPYVSTAYDQLEFRPSTLPVDTIYESYEGFPGGDRLVNDDGDVDANGKSLVDEEIQDGRDNDGDGLIDEDFGAISQQMFTCVYRDDTHEALSTYPEHVPMGLEITQRSFVWGIPGSDNFVGFEFTIKNDGREDLHNVYLGFFFDGDVGPVSRDFYWQDDRASILQLGSLGLIGETHDNDGDGGVAEGWIGLMLLGHTTDPTGRRAPPDVGLTSARFVSGGAAYENCGDPRNDEQRYDLLRSNVIGCQPGQLSATEDADYRMYFGVGPFRLFRRGSELTLQLAVVIGDGRDGLIESAREARDVFSGQYMDLDGDPETGVDGKETCLTLHPGEERWKFDIVGHCNLNPLLRERPEYRPVLISEPDCDVNPRQWVNLDCNWGTGVGGKESLVRWIGSTPPPCPRVETTFPPEEDYPCHTLDVDEETGIATPELIQGPAVQLVSQDENVLIRWNNASELVPDPLTKEYDFAGYRVWKAEQWERPEGSTGPTPDLWVLLAEYRLPKYLEPRTGQLSLSAARDPAAVTPCDTVDAAAGLYLYPVGYYQHKDEHVLPGFTYFYSVTAFDVNDTGERDPRTGRMKTFRFECRHVASEGQAIVTTTEPRPDIGEVFVTPNPYYGNAQWDLMPNPKDPTGTHVDFMNMPKGPWTLRIFTLVGDLVRIFENDGSRDIGQVKWDLVSHNGQGVVSGIYLFSVECQYGSQVGKFAILREQTYSR